MADTATADEEYRIVSTALDQAFYRIVNPDLNRSDVDPIRHYLECGWREGRDPAPWFSVRGYLELNPDIAEGGLEPLTHFLMHGGREGRAASPSEHAKAYLRSGADPLWSYDPDAPVPKPAERDSELQPLFTEYERQLVAAEFDAEFYFATNAYLEQIGVEPLEHFLSWGWREGRDPNPEFSVSDYLREYPDIREAGVNPFVHYLETGRDEGRRARGGLGFRHRVIVDQTSLEDRVADAVWRAGRTSAAPAKVLAKALAKARHGLKDPHITFSHDSFIGTLGGVQLCLQYEAAEIARLQRDHLHVCPASTWPVLRRDEPAALTVVLNGEVVGAFTPAAIVETLAAAHGGERGRGSFAIHNLLGHRVDEVLAILDAAGLEAGFFWLHDFTSLCAGYQLLRNDVQDCGAPPITSPGCGICLYREGRGPQVAEHERLFRKLRLTVVSPSQTTLDFWLARSSCQVADAVVHPHLQLVARGAAPAPSAAGPLRVAFLGLPAVHKGWPIFAQFAERHAEDPRYRFMQLGGRRDPRNPWIEFHHVAVSVDEPHAMQQAIERLEVDVALIWSIFRETFCLAAYEAVAGGAAIVTGPDSANVAALVEASGFGRVLADEAALARAFVSGEFAELARAARKPRLYDLEFSGMTADLLPTEIPA